MHMMLIDDLQDGEATGDRYDPLSMAFHWATVILIAAIVGSAWAREAAEGGGSAAWLLTIHRSLGILAWLITVLRLAWRAGCARTPPLPTTMRASQRLLAEVMQALLYATLITLPIAGFVQSILRGKAFALLIGTVPALVTKDKAMESLFHSLHEAGATVLLILIGLHALAGLYHGLVRRDGVLGAMLPFGRAPAAGERPSRSGRADRTQLDSAGISER